MLKYVPKVRSGLFCCMENALAPHPENFKIKKVCPDYDYDFADSVEVKFYFMDVKFIFFSLLWSKVL